MNSEDMFKNPFSNYNANTMEPDQIVEFWQNPFEGYINNVSEESIMHSENSIFFTGSRGSGKTMILKHYSYSSIKAYAKENDIYNSVMEKQFIGIYIRFDGPQLKSLYGLGFSDEQWNVIFTHYFELIVTDEYLNIILDIFKDENSNRYKKLIEEYCEVLGYTDGKNEILNNPNLLVNYIDKDINYVTHYKSEYLFNKCDFEPRRKFIKGELTGQLKKILVKYYKDFVGVNFLLLIDEYENFLEYQQKIINSYVKFKEDFAYRIGMRPYGFKTFDTINKDEFIKEDRDYQNYSLDNYIIKDTKNSSSYQKFLIKLSEKRLQSTKEFSEFGMTDIRKLLGYKENYEEEARKIVKNKKTHFEVYENIIKQEYNRKGIEYTLTQEQYEKLQDDNPLYEVQNLHLLLKKHDYSFVLKAFNDYKNNIPSEEGRKYKNDYDNKYKLSYIFILCRIYKVQNKLYYGFNDFSFLSSGIIGTYIELCRNTIQRAYYEEPDKLFKGHISPEIQTKAALDVSQMEMNQVCRINKFGDKLSNLTKNIGNEFSSYHKDYNIKYPETNQFYIVENSDKKTLVKVKNLINSAVMWAVFQIKKRPQQKSIDKKKSEIYILNHIFAPYFQISARTRGGYNVKFTTEDFVKMASKEDDSFRQEKSDNADESEEFHQLTIEDILNSNKYGE